MKRLYLSLLATIATVVLGGAGAASAAPQSMSFTANLSTDTGPVSGAVTIVTRVFDGENQKLWEERHDQVQPENGLVFLELGSVDRENNPLDTTVFDGGPRYLEIEVDGDVLSPRLALLSVPYATHAAYAEKAGEAALASEAEFATNAGALDGKSATDFADKSHSHPELLPRGTTLFCSGSQKVQGIDSNGNVVCANDLNSSTSYSAAGGLTLNSTTFSIASGGVTGSKLADNAVTSSKIANGTITGSDVKAGTLTGSHIANGSITGSDISSGTVTGSNIANGTITGSDVSSNTLTRSHISGERTVYDMPAGCGGGLTRSTSCKTRFAGITPAGTPHFLNCNGTVNLTNLVPATCNLSGADGYLLAP